MKRKAFLMIFMLLCNLIAQYSTVEAEGTPGTVAGDVHYGYATYYGGGYEGGCAMLDPVSKDYFVTALNIFDYNTAQMSGAYLEVTGPLGKINVLVTDLLPEGQKGDLDLNIDAFPHVANPIDGKVPVSWRIIPLNTNDPVQYKYKEGSSQYWMGVQVRNHRYPVSKLEYMDQSGKFVELPRKNYNYFESTQMGPGPYTFRVTDIYGQEIIDKNIPFTGSETTVSGTNQFPIRHNTATATPTPTPSPSPSAVNKCFIVGAIKPDVDITNDALNKGFTVRISGTQFSGNTDSNGGFKIEGIPEGTNVQLIITKPSFLTRNISIGRISSNITVKSPIDMWAGDVAVNDIQDGTINMVDVIEVAKAYNAVQDDQNYKQNVDLNQDGKINIADIVLMAKHFGKTSKDYKSLTF